MPTKYIMRGRERDHPPSLNALTQRASRFRAKAGCLSWEVNSGTDNKNQYLLSLLPEECKKPEINSTKSVKHDLDEMQTKVELVAANKGKFQQKRRKSKRSTEVETKNVGENSEQTLAEPSLSRDTADVDHKGKNKVLARSRFSDRDHDRQTPYAKRQKTDATTDGSEHHRTPTALQAISTRRSSRRAHRSSAAYLEIVDESEFYDAENENNPSIVRTPRRDMVAKTLPGELSITSSSVSKTAMSVLAKYGADLDPDSPPAYSLDFQIETEAALGEDKVDMRYMTPADAMEKAYIRRAIELTCIDFCAKKGEAISTDLVESHRNESYECQYRRIQAEFRRRWRGAKRVKLYHLPAWYGTVDRWRVPNDDQQGQYLMSLLRKGEKSD